MWKNVRKVFGSGQSDASSGTSMTTYCVVNSNSKLSILLRCYFHGVLEQLKTNFQTNFRFKKVLDFVIFARRSTYMTAARELSFKLKK